MYDPNPNRCYAGIPLGIQVQKQLGKEVIYRLRHGNGFFGAQIGITYQDKYDYFVPSSITNAEGQHSRDVFSAAIAAWQALPEEIKDLWRAKERYSLPRIGYNLFVSDYMKRNL